MKKMKISILIFILSFSSIQIYVSGESNTYNPPEIFYLMEDTTTSGNVRVVSGDVKYL